MGRTTHADTVDVKGLVEHTGPSATLLNLNLACLLPVALSGQVVNNGCRGDGLSRARWTLDEAERTL